MNTPTDEIVKSIAMAITHSEQGSYDKNVIFVREAIDTVYNCGVKAEAKRRDGIEHAIEQSIIDQHVTIERSRIASKLKTMYLTAVGDELSADAFHRFGHNLAIDKVLALLNVQ